MSPLKKQREQLHKISRLVHDLATAVDDLIADFEKADGSSLKDAKPVFEADDLRQDYQRLRDAVESGAPIETEVAQLLERSSKERLKAFLRVNGLPIESHSSKPKIQAQLVQLLRQSKAIGAPVKTLAGVP